MLTINDIKQAVIPLAEKYNISKIDLFGSYADGNLTEQLGADFLVEFNVKVPSIFKVMGFKEELKNHLNHPVDVMTLPIARPDMLRINKVVNIYERT
jgi:predicted nucleotidyltransferase